jgi:hypothetical protein
VWPRSSDENEFIGPGERHGPGQHARALPRSGGNYDHTAGALNIHRSTLRYRLGRIRDISGRDLQDVNSRLNLHLAFKLFEMTGNFDIHHEDL